MNSGKKYDVKTFALFGAFMGLAIALIITIVSILILPEIVKEVADIFAEGGIPTQDQIDSAEKICWIIFWIINVVSWVYFAISFFLGLWLRHLSKKSHPEETTDRHRGHLPHLRGALPKDRRGHGPLLHRPAAIAGSR